MKKTLSILLATSVSFFGLHAGESLPDPDGKPADMKKPVQVFILLGQSNMLGFGKIKGGDGSLEHATSEKKLYPYLVDDSGSWTERKDVRFVRVMQARGNMKVFNNEFMTIKGNIGPEIGIGHHVGNLIDAPVMILKSCIGNRSLGWDLLPPGTSGYKHDGKQFPGYKETFKSKKDKTIVPFVKGGDCMQWYAGKQYDDDIGNAKKILSELDKYYPGARSYEVAGFLWWQGDKDMRNPAHYSKYEENLGSLLAALRKDFKAPKAKMVVASLGQTKKGSSKGDGVILEAMTSFSKKNNDVEFVYTHPLSKGGSSSGHYNKHAETYMNVGEAMGEAMVKLLK